MGHADLQTYLVELLMKQDQMSMAASIESRVPFLDHEFVEHVTAIPGRFKLHGWQTKAVLRAALRDCRAARNSHGAGRWVFPVPVGRWIRRTVLADRPGVRLGPGALERGLFKPDACYGAWQRSTERGRRTMAIASGSLSTWKSGSESSSMVRISLASCRTVSARCGSFG